MCEDNRKGKLSVQPTKMLTGNDANLSKKQGILWTLMPEEPQTYHLQDTFLTVYMKYGYHMSVLLKDMIH